jgi:hypothetical protein
MPNKPIKWGFKLWVLCASDNGYVVDFNVYLGRKEGQSDEGLTHNVVIKLLEPSDPHTPAISLGTGYHLYVDNYYTSGNYDRDMAKMMMMCIMSWCAPKDNCLKISMNGVSLQLEQFE